MENGVDIINEGKLALQSAGSILEDLTIRHGKAKAYFELIVQKSKKGIDLQLYNTIANELKRYNATKKTFNEQRTPVTSVLSKLSQPFIDLENDFDKSKEGSMAFQLQAIADSYVKNKELEKKEKSDLIEKELAKSKEIERIKTEASLFIKSKLVEAKEAICLDIDAKLNIASLDNIDQVKEEIAKADFSVPELLYKDFNEEVEVFVLSNTELNVLFNEVKKSHDIRVSLREFNDELSVYQHDALAKIPAIHDELMEIEKAESEEAAAELITVRKERIKTDTERKKSEFKKELQEVEIDRNEKVELVNMQKDFEAKTQQAVVTGVGVKSKKKWKINLDYPAGIAEVCKFWIEYARPKDPKKANAMTIGRMILFAERQMNNNSYKIESQYVHYVEDVKAKV